MSDLVVEVGKGGVAVLALNRPDIHNAFDDKLIAALTKALQKLEKDKKVRAVVLCAEGKSFSAGADLNWMKRVAEYDEQENYFDAMKLGELLRTLNALPKPTIARVHGAAYGGGVGLIAACDIAIGTQGAMFGLTEVRLGIIPAVISPYVVAAIGERNARRYFLTGERFTAAEAYRIGLLNDLTPDEESLDRVISEILEALLQGGPAAVTEAKDLISAVAWRPVNDSLIADTAERIARVRASKEGKEGLTAFLHKRKPAWAKK
ncbi:MAG: enoyl-CoA hydratase/isomerase family protein [Burkholderiales bacterium]